MTRTKRKAGRPPKARNEKQAYRVAVNLTLPEAKALKDDARTMGVSLSEALRLVWREWHEKQGKA